MDPDRPPHFYPTQMPSLPNSYPPQMPVYSPFYPAHPAFQPQPFTPFLPNQLYPAMTQLIPAQYYSSSYQNVSEILYFEQGDGEIFVYFDPRSQLSKLVTCIDITSLYKEKRGKAITIIKFLC